MKIFSCKSIVFVLLASIFVLLCTACQLETRAITDSSSNDHQLPSKHGLTLSWQDQFDADSLDQANWNIKQGSNEWSAAEQPYYSNLPSELWLDNGSLHMAANYRNYRWRTAQITSKDKYSFTYGYVEIRARLPLGKGTWPAFFLLPQQQNYGTHLWPDNGEIGIIEHAPTYGLHRLVSRIFTKNTQLRHGHYLIPEQELTAINEWHTYGLLWNQKGLYGYIDDQLVGQFLNNEYEWESWPFNQPFYIVIDLGIQISGAIDHRETQLMEIDYVRVYQ
jgi:beta-glucanase (GH16 family)